MDLKKVKEQLEKVPKEARASLPAEVQEVLGHLDGIVGDWTKKSQAASETAKQLEELKAKLDEYEKAIQYQNTLLDQWERYYKALPEGLRDQPQELSKLVETAGKKLRTELQEDEEDQPIWQRKDFQEHFNRTLSEALGKHIEPKIKELSSAYDQRLMGLGQYIVGLMKVMKTDPEADFDQIIKVTQEKGIMDPLQAYSTAYADKLLEREVEKRLQARLEEERQKAPPVEGSVPGAPPVVRIFKPTEAPKSWEEAEEAAMRLDVSKYLSQQGSSG